MAVFLRENVAKAGSSNAFTGYEELPVYLQQAYEALRLGEKNAPYFWHYEFSDYMVPYLMERATPVNTVWNRLYIQECFT